MKRVASLEDDALYVNLMSAYKKSPTCGSPLGTTQDMKEFLSLIERDMANAMMETAHGTNNRGTVSLAFGGDEYPKTKFYDTTRKAPKVSEELRSWWESYVRWMKIYNADLGHGSTKVITLKDKLKDLVFLFHYNHPDWHVWTEDQPESEYEPESSKATLVCEDGLASWSITIEI